MVRAGASPLDVEAELARLLGEPAGGEQALAGPQPEREARERELEIRQMLEARSARMVRAGGSPLDVEAELARLLGEPADGDGDQR
jgi:hypothetical protein